MPLTSHRTRFSQHTLTHAPPFLLKKAVRDIVLIDFRWEEISHSRTPRPTAIKSSWSPPISSLYAAVIDSLNAFRSSRVLSVGLSPASAAASPSLFLTLPLRPVLPHLFFYQPPSFWTLPVCIATPSSCSAKNPPSLGFTLLCRGSEGI